MAPALHAGYHRFESCSGYMKRYFAKPNTWFDAGTEAIPVTDFWDHDTDKGAIFLGIKDGKPDEESCLAREFIVTEDDDEC